MTEQFLSIDQVKGLVKDAVTEAVRAINTVDPAERPAGGRVEAPNLNLNRYKPPRLGVAMRAMFNGAWDKDSVFERDVSQAAASVFGFSKSDFSTGEQHDGMATRSSFFWPKDIAEYAQVMSAMGEKGSERAARAYEAAVRAGAEGTITAPTFSTGATGGFLVPPEFAQDEFVYALISPIAVSNMGVRRYQADSPVVYLPRESAVAGGSQAAEAGTLSVTDPTFAQQTITIKKQYSYQQYSNELLRDASPSWNEFLARTLARNVGLVQDLEYLTGSGSGAHITGLANVSGVTATSGQASTGTNGASPTFDMFFDAVDGLRAANSEPDFVIGNPRLLTSLSKIKDSTGNYILSNQAGYNAPAAFTSNLPGATAPKAVILGILPAWYSSQITINNTVGTSTDCSTVLVGRREHILIVERQGIEIAYSEHVGFTTDQSAVRVLARSAIAVLQPTSLMVITGVRK